MPKRRATDVATHFSKYLEILYDAARIGLWDWDLRTGSVIYSKQWESILGYNEGELPQDVSSWEKAVLPGDLALAENEISRYLAGETSAYVAEFRMVRKDGSIIWAQDKGTITERDEDGNPTHLLGVLQDVTFIKEAEEKARQNSEQLDFVAKLSELGMWDWDLTTNIISYNDEYLRMIGYTQDEITGTLEEWESFNHPEDLVHSSKLLDDYLSGRIDAYSCEIRMRHKDGHYIWTLDTGRISEWDEHGTPTRVLGGHLNIDKIKRTEKALQQALREIEQSNVDLEYKIQQGIRDLERMEQNAHVMFDANPHVSVIFDDTFKIVDCNPAALDFFRIPSKEAFLQQIDGILATSIPTVNSDGTPAISVHDRLTYAMQHGFCQFETDIILEGECIPLDLIFKKIPYNETFGIAAYQLDLRWLKKAESEVAHRDKLLQSVNTIATMLISAEQTDFQQTVWESLRILGEAVGVDRVYIWKNYVENGVLYSSQVHEWSGGAEPQQGNELTVAIPMDEAIPTWRERLSNGHSVNSLVRDMSPSERRLLDPQAILSILVLPILMQNEFWGFIGFDDCKHERVFTDIEERILQSAALLISAAMLRNLMTENLVQAKEEALSSTQAKSAFLANMSHEIRTPMNAIIGMTAIAKNTTDPDKIGDCLNKIQSASKHLLGIINDVLDMSKIEANKFELISEEFVLEGLLSTIRSIMMSRMNEKKQQFNISLADDVPFSVISDELRISQLITNLLSNANKFTPEGGHIDLTVTQVSPDPKQPVLQIKVADSGIGIAAEKIPVLFDAFEQLDRGVSKKYGGTGLGLAICKRIVELMGGRIDVESVPNKSTTFTLTIPVQLGTRKREDIQTEVLEQTTYNFSGKCLLLVEDIAINREIALALLEETDAEVDCAENGMIAYEMFVANPDRYDLIFMDIHMPILDGYGAAEKIRAVDIPQAKKVPIIAMTANAFAEDIARCKAVGMDDHIAKPISQNVLLEKTARHLR